MKEAMVSIINLLSPTAVADRTGLSLATLAKWRWARTGPPYVKLGSKVAYPESSLTQWLEANLHPTEELQQ